MKYKNFLIHLFDLILVLGLLAGYQAVIYSRDKEATIAELKSMGGCNENPCKGNKADAKNWYDISKGVNCFPPVDF